MDDTNIKNDPYGIREIQLYLLRMLKDIDIFCRENGIQYSLNGGTLLGAIRHNGFIPWDDDVDIMLDRPNYEKFIQVATDRLPEHYSIIGKTWVKRISRKDNPAIQDEELCIDLFVMDEFPLFWNYLSFPSAVFSHDSFCPIHY